MELQGDEIALITLTSGFVAVMVLATIGFTVYFIVRAAKGSPPPITLPSVVRSGRMPKRACAPPRATRNPVITSSKMSTAPWRVQFSRSACRNPDRGSTRFMLPATGSTMTPAMSLPMRSNSAFTCAVSL